MPASTQSTAGHQVAANLIQLTKNYKSSSPQQATDFRRAFKEQSKNDLCRILVYLLEVVGSNDQANKYLEGENKDLRELLKLNGIDPDAEVPDDTPNTEAANDKEAAPSTGLASETKPQEAAPEQVSGQNA
jgi:hypothetical protein